MYGLFVVSGQFSLTRIKEDESSVNERPKFRDHMRLYARDLAGLLLVCLCEISVGPRGNDKNRKPQPRPLMFRVSLFFLLHLSIYLFADTGIFYRTDRLCR